MKCCFFGHSDFDYASYADNIRAIVINLIINHGVTIFYSGGRGNFDSICAKVVGELRQDYPYIQNIKFLSYMPTNAESSPPCPSYYTGTEYLLEKHVIPKFAIVETNRCVVDQCHYIVSGVCRNYGGALQAIKYARGKKKTIINVFDAMQ